MNSVEKNTLRSTGGQTQDTTSLSSLRGLLTRLEVLNGRVRTVEQEVIQAVSGLLLSEQDRRVQVSLLHLASSVCGSMENSEDLRSTLIATSKTLLARVEFLNKLKGVN